MPILDKLMRGRIDEERLKKLTAFVEEFSSEVRESHGDAISGGVKNPLVWLIDCEDGFGRQMAEMWLKDEVAESGKAVGKMPTVITRAVSFRKAHDRLSQSSLLDITIPEPSKDQIDILAATLGGIWVVGVPLEPHRQLLPKPRELMVVLHEQLVSPRQDLLLQAVVEPVERTQEGQLIRALSVPWFEILREIERDPEFLFLFAKNPRRFEEFIAASYERAGWPQVVLTPPSGDGGRDVIATMPGLGSVRFLEQCKAYSPGNLVTHNDVRAMLGTLQTSSNASKGIVTTTSGFQPGILKTKEFEPFLPYRLELRDGENLRRWLQEIADEIS